MSEQALKVSWKNSVYERHRTPEDRVVCSVAGCQDVPSERKPFCGKHIDRLPYVRKVVAETAQIAKEFSEVSRLGPSALDPRGILAQDVITVLQQHGVLTAAKIPNLLGEAKGLVHTKAWTAILTALEKAGAIRILKLGSRRGTTRTVVELVKDYTEAPAAPVSASTPTVAPSTTPAAPVSASTPTVEPSAASCSEDPRISALGVAYEQRLIALTELVKASATLRTTGAAFRDSLKDVEEARRAYIKAHGEA